MWGWENPIRNKDNDGFTPVVRKRKKKNKKKNSPWGIFGNTNADESSNQSDQNNGSSENNSTANGEGEAEDF